MKNLTFAALFTSMALAVTLGVTACGSSEQATEAPAAPEATATTEQEKAPAATEEAAPAESTKSDAATSESTKSDAATTNATTSAPAQNVYIGDEAAKSAALAHAGLNAADVVELQSELDLDDATIHYDVEFKSGGMEYDYDIDAVTGDVIYFNSEVDD